MTKELAIRILRGDVLGTNEQTHEAVFMAIRALKAEPNSCEYWDSESRFCALRRPQAEPTKHGAKIDEVKNELLARIVNNSPICRNCNIYRDAWNICFMASECLTNGFKFFKQRMNEVEE